jgi:hypothetical protein
MVLVNQISKESNVNCEYWQPSSQGHFHEHCCSKWHSCKKTELCTLRREPDGPQRHVRHANSNCEEEKCKCRVFFRRKDCFEVAFETCALLINYVLTDVLCMKFQMAGHDFMVNLFFSLQRSFLNILQWCNRRLLHFGIWRCFEHWTFRDKADIFFRNVRNCILSNAGSRTLGTEYSSNSPSLWLG